MFSKEIYITRRTKLRKALGKGLVLFFGNEMSSINYLDNYYPFRQDSNFFYFFGINRPHLVGLMDMDTGRDMLFGDDATMTEIIWTGPVSSLSDLGKQAGVGETFPYSKIIDMIQSALSAKRPIHFLPPYRTKTKVDLSNLLGIALPNIDDNVSEDLIHAVVSLRSIKDKLEIEQIEEAVSVAHNMFATARAKAKPGVTEFELAGVMKAVAACHGCFTSYPIIATMDGHILHSEPRHIPLVKDRLIIIDAGAETKMGYASDITRTFPVSGQFDRRQKEIYQIVLNVNTETINCLKPGMSYRDAHLNAAKIIATGLVEIGLMSGDVEEIVAQGAHALFFPHGLGHLMGLDVHDMEGLGEDYVGYGKEVCRSEQFGLSALRFAKKLEPGHVITVEPGCYFNPFLIDKWRQERLHTNFINYDRVEAFKDFGGIRIEDDVLITDTGCRILGPPIPKEIKQIEDQSDSG